MRIFLAKVSSLCDRSGPCSTLRGLTHLVAYIIRIGIVIFIEVSAGLGLGFFHQVSLDGLPVVLDVDFVDSTQVEDEEDEQKKQVQVAEGAPPQHSHVFSPGGVE